MRHSEKQGAVHEARGLLKKALILSSQNSSHLIHELPYLLKKAQFHVTVLSPPHWTLTHNSFIDELIDAPPSANVVIEQVAKLLEKSKVLFDLIILGSDPLAWALVDSDLKPTIKGMLSPIKNSAYLAALNGKIELAEICKQLKILMPPSESASSSKEALEIAEEIGFPVMIKVSRSGGGNGVYECDNSEQIVQTCTLLQKPFLVEKYIEGELISIEPLFLNSELKGYAYSIMTYSPKPFEPSLQRIFKPCPEIEEMLHRLGKVFMLHGFFNMSLILEKKSGRHYLLELDFRPNRWVRYSQLVGVDWVKALQNHENGPIQRPQMTKELRHFQSDLEHALKTKNRSGILYWLLNRNDSWKSIPLYDQKTVLWGACRLAKKLLFL